SLEAKLKRSETLSSADEKWLDNEANIIDEQRVLEQLELASDYEREVARLDNKGKAIVEKLREWAGELLVKMVGRKRKQKENKVPKEKPVPAQAAPVFTKKENATLAQRIEILDWYHKHKQGQTKTAEHFALIYPNLQIKQPLVSAWLKDEAKWRAQWQETNCPSDRMAKRAQQTEHPE
ncbi:hypothetical protein H4582DRAFT_1788482, partial [Lactarius indigo]